MFDNERAKKLPASVADAVVSESFSERIVVDLQLGNLFVLIGRHGDKWRHVKRESVERRPAHAEDIIGLNDVQPRLVLMHRIENYL